MKLVLQEYMQIAFFYIGYTITFSGSKGKYTKSQSSNNLKEQNLNHNRQKNYILNEGEQIPALVDLGVFNQNYQIIKSKFDKFKQINRFIELIDDSFSKTNLKEITILDFGCGKSYLTFIIYYYFVYIKKIKATVIGYDLKEDVVQNCNAIALRYGYENLKFYVNDVTKGNLYNKPIDMIITLHACEILPQTMH